MTKERLVKLIQEASKVSRLQWQQRLSGRTNCISTEGYIQNSFHVIAGTNTGEIISIDEEGNISNLLKLENEQITWLDSSDIDADGVSEILAGTQTGRIVALTRNNKLKWTSDVGDWVDSIFVVQSPNEDAYLLTGTERGLICALDKDGNQIWQWETGHNVLYVQARDLNCDGSLEMIASSRDGGIYVFNHNKTLSWSADCRGWLTALHTADFDNDGLFEIATGGWDRTLFLFSSNGDLVWSYKTPGWIADIDSEDLTGDGFPEIVTGSRDGSVIVLDRNGKPLWVIKVEGIVKGIKATIRKGRSWITIACEDGRLFCYDISLRAFLREEIGNILQSNPDIIDSLDTDDFAILSSLFGDFFDKNQSESLRLSKCESLLKQENYADLLALTTQLERYGLETLWTRHTPETMDDVYAFDIDCDSETEVIAASGDGTVWAFDQTGNVIWHFDPGETKGMWSVRADDINHDGIVEIAAGCKSGVLYILNPDGEVVLSRSELSGIRTLDISLIEKESLPKLILGCERHCVHLLDSELKDYKVFPTEGWVRSVCAGDIDGDGEIEILASARDGDAYLFDKDGKIVWRYKTYDWARTALIADVDLDGDAEAIIGCGNGSVYCLNENGRLKWLYKFAHRVDTICTVDLDHDGQTEILVGTESGDLAILSPEGDLKSLYPIGYWVRSLHIADLTGDGQPEIIGASADRLVFTLAQVEKDRLLELKRIAWQNLDELNGGKTHAIESLLKSRSKWKQISALDRLLSSSDLAPEDFLDLFRSRTSILEPEVKRAWLNNTKREFFSPTAWIEIVETLINDENLYVRENVAQVLATRDWQQNSRYLKVLTSDARQSVRRMAIKSIGDHLKNHSEIAPELVTAIAEDPSEWVRSEAAKALARYLDSHPEKSIELTHWLLRVNAAPQVFDWLGNMASVSCARSVMDAYYAMLTGPDLESAHQILALATKGWELMLQQCKQQDKLAIIEARSCYSSLNTLFEATTISNLFLALGTAFDQMEPPLEVFEYLRKTIIILEDLQTQISKYMNREALGDRLAALLDAVNVLEVTQSNLTTLFCVEPGRPVQFPERYLFEILIQHLREIIKQELQDLRGQAELEITLKTKTLPRDATVTVALGLRNIGKSPAESLLITLEENDYEVLGNPSFSIPLLPSQSEANAEFAIKPKAESHRLLFQVEYKDAASPKQTLNFADRVELETAHRVFERLNNPYVAGLPIDRPEMFFGRQKIISFLKANFTESVSQNIIVLHGQRRTGKTSILFQLRDFHLPPPNIPVYIDMQSFMDFTSSRLFYKIARQISREAKKAGVKTERPRLEDYEAEPILTFDEFLDDLEDEIDNQKIILLIDEFEILEVKVKSGLISQDIFGYFRSLMQHRRFFGFVFAGTHTLQLMSQTYWSIFFNIALHQRVSFLDEDSATALITRPLSDQLAYDPISIEKIKSLTGNHPYFIQLLCRSLVYRCNQRETNYVTLTDVNAVLKQVLDTGQDHFQFVWQNASSPERLLLSAIAHQLKDDICVTSLHDITALMERHRLGLTSNEVKDVVQKLVYQDLVQEVSKGQQFKLTIGLIRLWLQQTKPIKNVVLEYKSDD